jgi:hypothetical protein
MNKSKRPTPIVSSALLGSAVVNTDRPRKRGEICRGAYIADATGSYYLTTRGTWTNGIQGDDNWWHDETAACNFLAGLQRKAQEPNDELSHGGETTR